MTLSWWQMPGPARFIDGVIQEMREGRNTFLLIPRHFPSGLRESIRRQVQSSMDIPWRTLDLSELDSHRPVESILRLFDPASRIVGPVTFADMIANEKLNSGYMIWAELSSAEEWPTWKSFFQEYAHACRAVPLVQRSLFCVLLSGEPAIQPPQVDICLAALKWQGVVNQMDSLLYASLQFGSKPWPAKKRQLAAYLTAFLGQWDPTLIDLLHSSDFKHLLKPHDLLHDSGISRGWDQCDFKKSSHKWAEGISDHFEGMEREHAAYLALNGSSHLVTHKIWAAETTVLFPHIEEFRHQLLDAMAGRLVPPFRSVHGELVEDPRELELSDLLNLLANDPSLWIDSGTWGCLKAMKFARNQLAHKQPIDPELLESDDMFRLPSQVIT